MEHLYSNIEVVTLDEQIHPRHPLAQLIGLVAVVAFVLALAIPRANAPEPVIPPAGAAVRAAICAVTPTAITTNTPAGYPPYWTP